jgi:hypothetical protein
VAGEIQRERERERERESRETVLSRGLLYSETEKQGLSWKACGVKELFKNKGTFIIYLYTYVNCI